MVDKPKFAIGDHVEKVSGSSWRGRIVGTYATDLTPEGYAVESDTETGSVQIYPAKALRLATPANGEQVERVARALADRFIERGKARVTGASYSSYDDMPGSYCNDFLADARAAIAAMDPTPTQDCYSYSSLGEIGKNLHIGTPTQDARERVKVLEEALKPFAALAGTFDAASRRFVGIGIEGQLGSTRLPVGGEEARKTCVIAIDDLIRARTALGNQGKRL